MYNTTTYETEFLTFRKLAQSVLIRYERKQDNTDYRDDNDYADVLALYMLNKLSRYGLTKFFESHWLWNKVVDSLSLAEILTEADRYKPEYDKKQEEVPC